MGFMNKLSDKVKPLGVYRTSLLFNLKMVVLYSYTASPVLMIFFNFEKIVNFSDELLLVILKGFIGLTLMWMISAAGVTAIYSVKIYDDHIRGYLQSGKKSSCYWPEIKKIEIQNLWPCKYIQLIGDNGHVLMVIPYNGLSNYDNFKQAVQQSTKPHHPLYKFLDNI